jgi:hypothetical protein
MFRKLRGQPGFRPLHHAQGLAGTAVPWLPDDCDRGRSLLGRRFVRQQSNRSAAGPVDGKETGKPSDFPSSTCLQPTRNPPANLREVHERMLEITFESRFLHGLRANHRNLQSQNSFSDRSLWHTGPRRTANRPGPHIMIPAQEGTNIVQAKRGSGLRRQPLALGTKGASVTRSGLATIVFTIE